MKLFKQKGDEEKKNEKDCALDVQLERLSSLKLISNTIQLNALDSSFVFF